MNLAELITGLKDWKTNDQSQLSGGGADMSEEYINMVNDANSEYRTHILDKLGLNSTIILKQSGGASINFESTDNSESYFIDKISKLDEDHVMQQLGGGLIDWLKSIFSKRDFDSFKARYDKMRGELEDKMISYELEAKTLQSLTTEKAEKMRALLLNGKKKTMLEIYLDNEKAPEEMTAEKRIYVEKEVKTATTNTDLHLKQIEEFDKTIKAKMEKKRTFFSFGSKKFIDKLRDKVEDDFKKFDKIFKEFIGFTAEVARVRELKVKYATLAPEMRDKLFDKHKAELRDYEKHKAKYDKIEAFTDIQMQEAHQILQRKELFLQTIFEYKTLFEDIDGQKHKAKDELTKWDGLLRTTYVYLSQAIELGNKYSKYLSTAAELVKDNGNLLKTISASALKTVVDEYELHLESVSRTAEILKRLVATLIEIKNSFIDLVPGENLQEDILYVGAARTYILGLIENIKRRQLLFGSGDGGRGYLKGAIKNQVGGVVQINNNFAPAGYPIYFKQLGYCIWENVNADTVTTPGPAVVNGAGVVLARPGNYNFGPPANGPGWFSGEEKIYMPGPPVRTTEISIFLNPKILPYGALPYYEPPGIIYDKISQKYTNFIGANRNISYLPVYDIKIGEISVYSFQLLAGAIINDINNIQIDFNNLFTNDNTDKPKQFIPINDSGGVPTNYYVYNIYNSPATDVHLKRYMNTCKITGTDKIILPLFYKIRQLNGFVTQDEYHLINPITGIPIISDIQNFVDVPYNGANKFQFANTTLELDLVGIKTANLTHITDLDNNAPANRDKYFYNYNCKSIKYNVNSLGAYLSIHYTNPQGGALQAAGPPRAWVAQPAREAYPVSGSPIAQGHPDAIPAPIAVAPFMPFITQPAPLSGWEAFRNSDKDLSNDPLFSELHWHMMIQLTHYFSSVINAILTTQIAGETITDTPIPQPPAYIPAMANSTTLQFTDTNIRAIIDKWFGLDAGPTLRSQRFMAVLMTRVLFHRKFVDSTTGDSVLGLKTPKQPIVPGITGPAGPAGIAVASISRKSEGTTLQAKQTIAYVMRLMDKSSPYWKNLDIIMDNINKFFTKEYTENFEMVVARIQDNVNAIRKIETGVLQITDKSKSKIKLPGYNIIIKEMEVKGDSSATVKGEAAKGLKELVDTRKDFIKKFEADLSINGGNIINILAPLLGQALSVDSTKVDSAEWFNNPAEPDRKKALIWLRNGECAKQFIEEIKKNPTFAHALNKISAVVIKVVNGLDYPEAHAVYKANVGNAGPRDGKKDKNKKNKGGELRLKYGHQHQGKHNKGHHGK